MKDLGSLAAAAVLLMTAGCKQQASKEAEVARLGAPGGATGRAARQLAVEPSCNRERSQIPPASLPTVPLPENAVRFEGKNFEVHSGALPGCRTETSCTALAELRALRGFKVNQEYPFKFVPDAATAPMIEGAAQFVTTGADTGRLTIKFRRPTSDPVRIAGAFKLSVCSDESCQIETAPLGIDLP